MNDKELADKAYEIVRGGVRGLDDPPSARTRYSLEQRQAIVRQSRMGQKRADFRNAMYGLITVCIGLWIVFDYLQPIITNFFTPKAPVTQRAFDSDDEDDGTGL